MKRMSTCTLTHVPSVGNEVDDRCDSINKKNVEGDRALFCTPLACGLTSPREFTLRNSHGGPP